MEASEAQSGRRLSGWPVNGASAIRNGDLQTTIEMAVAQQYGIAGSGPSENWTLSAETPLFGRGIQVSNPIILS